MGFFKNSTRKGIYADGGYSAKSILDGDLDWIKAMDGRTSDEEREILINKSRKEYNDGIPEYHEDLRENRPESNGEDFEDESDEGDSGQESMLSPSKFMGMFQKSHNPATDILFKKDNEIAEDEINKSRKYSYYESNDSHVNQLLNKRISSWYDNMYGANPITRDATGRQVEPKIKMASSLTGTLKGKENNQIFDGLSQLARRMSDIQADKTPEKGVMALQKSLNRLGVQPTLKEDNELGPKTDLQTRLYIANNGYNKLDEVIKNKLYAK